MAGAKLLLIWVIFLIFHICQTSNFLWNCRILFERLSQSSKLVGCAFRWTCHWRWSLFYPWLLFAIWSWAWHLCFIISESLSGWFKLWCSCWVDLDDDTVAVGDCFDVGFYDIFTNVILPRACFYDRFLIKKRFSEGGRVKRSWMLWSSTIILLKILTWAGGIR